MSVEVWGQMPKSSEDAEKVEEAIDRIVGEHNDNPDAHLAEGQSLTSHRASEIIDHVARSVVGDKVNSIHDMWDDADHGNVTDYVDGLLTDNTKNWVVNQWAGHYVVNAGDEFNGDAARIVSNTATTLTIEFGFGDYPNIGDLYIITQAVGDGPWSFYSGGIAPFNARACNSNNPGDYLEASWEMNNLVVYCAKGPDAGKIDISVDGSVVATVDLYASTTQGRIAVYQTTFETLVERTIRVTVRADKNASSADYFCYLQSFDFNGIISFASLATAIVSRRNTMMTNSNGYSNQGFFFGNGYSYIAISGIDVSGKNSSVVATPKVFYYPYDDGVYIMLDDGQPNTTFTVTIWALCAVNDPYYGD